MTAPHLAALLALAACHGDVPPDPTPACDPAVTELRPPDADPAVGAWQAWLGAPVTTQALDLAWDDGLPFAAYDEVVLTVDPGDDPALFRASFLAENGTCEERTYAVHAAELLVDPADAPLRGTAWAWFDPDLVRTHTAFSPYHEFPLPAAARWHSLVAAHGVVVIGQDPDPWVALDGDGTSGTVLVHAVPRGPEDQQPVFRAGSGTYATP